MKWLVGAACHPGIYGCFLVVLVACTPAEAKADPCTVFYAEALAYAESAIGFTAEGDYTPDQIAAALQAQKDEKGRTLDTMARIYRVACR